MKNTLRLTIWLSFVLLIGANIFLFCSSINLSNQINVFEEKIQTLHKKNLTLEEKVSNVSSLKYAQEKAKEMGFTVTSTAVYLEKLEYALKPN